MPSTSSINLQTRQASSTSTVLTGDVAALGSGVVAAASLVVALVLAVAGLAAGMVKGGQILFECSRSVANTTIEIDNFAKKTDLSLRTIEGLSGLAAAADVPLNSLASSLGTFEKSSEWVREGNKGLSTAFRSLHIDIKDNETALRSAFEALGHLPPGYQRVAAAQRLFGEGGKDILLLLDRSNGSLDEAIQRYDELGTLIGGKAVSESRRFKEQLNLIDLQWQALKTTIAVEFMPVITDFMTQISNWLSANRGQWEAWGQGIKEVLLGVINSDAFQALLFGLSLLGKLGASSTPPSIQDQINSSQYDATANRTDPESLRNQKIAARIKTNVDLGLGTAAPRGSDPAAAAKRIAELRLKATLDGIVAEEAAIDR